MFFHPKMLIAAKVHLLIENLNYALPMIVNYAYRYCRHARNFLVTKP